MKQEEEKLTGLPENAFRELKPGEVYNPLMSPNKKYPEVNLWSVLWGIAMAILFSAAAAYLGLKVGQVFEAAIPIAIIAVGVSVPALLWQVPFLPCPPYTFYKKLIRRKSRLLLLRYSSVHCWEAYWVFSSSSHSVNIL